jgi:C_GCAxxG_C_C family probable redox protein
LQEKLGIGNKEVFKSASALAGGVARQGETCGALLGSIMAIGVEVGREKLEDKERYQKAMEPAMEMYAKFKKQVGHTLCQEIHRIRFGRVYRMYIPEERDAFHNMGGHSRKGCPEVCGIAAKIASEIILKLRKRK